MATDKQCLPTRIHYRQMVFNSLWELQNTAFKDDLLIKGFLFACFLTMRHVSSWQHLHPISKTMMSTEEPPRRICFFVASCYLARTCPRLSCRLHAIRAVDKQDTKGVDCQVLLGQGRQVFHNSCITEKCVRDSGTGGQRCCPNDAEKPPVPVQAYSPSASAISVILESACLALPVYSGTSIPSRVCDGLRTR